MIVSFNNLKNLCFFIIFFSFLQKIECAKNVIDIIIEKTTPITEKNLKRLPLFVWISIPENLSDEEIRDYLVQLKDRNIVVFTKWHIPKEGIEKGIKEAMRVDRIKKELEYPIAIDATSIVHRIFDGAKIQGILMKKGIYFLICHSLKM